MSVPTVLETVKLTVKTPSSLYTCTGWFSVDVRPSPKSQSQPEGELLDWSVKATGKGLGPEVGEALNCATGAVADAGSASEKTKMPVWSMPSPARDSVSPHSPWSATVLTISRRYSPAP